MNTQRFAKEIRRKNPSVNHFIIIVEENDGCKVLSVKNEAGDVLGRCGEGYGYDDVTWDDLNDWARALVFDLQVFVELIVP